MAAPVILGSTASVASGTSGLVTPAMPDGSALDWLLFLAVWGTSAAATIADRPIPSNGISGDASFQHLGSIFGGSAAAYGTDTGPRGASAWGAIASSATGATDAIGLTNSATGTAGTRTLGALAVRISHTAGKVPSWAFTGGQDTNAADAWGPAGQTDIGGLLDDLLIGLISGIPQASNPTPTLAWTGLTVGGQALVKSSGVSSGAGVRFHARQAATLTGGPSSGAPTGPSATTGLAGVMGFIRVREVDPPPAVGAWQVGSIAMG